MKTPRSAALALLGLAGCSARTPRLAPLPVPFAAESVRVDTVAPGLLHYAFWSSRGPWAIDVLDADRRACWSAVALKAGNRAVGRSPARAQVQALADTSRHAVGGGMNADFFWFEPPGVPYGAHVSHGRVISGPFTRPVLAFDSAGNPWAGVLESRGWARVGGDSIPLGAWNQRRMPGLRLFDHAWGAVTDTATGAVEVAVRGAPASVVAIDTTTAGLAIPEDGIVLSADRLAPEALRERLRSLRIGDPVSWQVSLVPFAPAEAVGGFPILLADSVVIPGLDSAGGARFGPVRHPRTAVGLAANGRRLLFVVVDGRQLPWSDGMTLRELADLFLRLGAPRAINLDGGGSTEMVMNRGGVMSIVNRPSDPIERPVGNALALIRVGAAPCGRP